MASLPEMWSNAGYSSRSEVSAAARVVAVKNKGLRQVSASVVAVPVVQPMVLVAEVVAAFDRGKALQQGRASVFVAQPVVPALDRLPVAERGTSADAAVHRGRERRTVRNRMADSNRGYKLYRRCCRDRGH